MNKTTHAYPFQAILLLGLALNPDQTPKEEMMLRAAKAAELFRRGLAPRIIACGADSIGCGVTEAVVLRKLLLDSGIPEDAVFMEAQSMVTYENIQFAKKLLPDHKKKIAVVTSAYHVFRAVMLCRKAGLKAKGFGSKVPDPALLKARRKLERFYCFELLVGWEKTTERHPRFLARLYGKWIAPYQEAVRKIEEKR